MSLIDRINAAIVRRLHRDRPAAEITATDVAIIVTAGQARTVLTFKRLTAAHAALRDVFVGSVAVLILHFEGDGTIEFNESDAGWKAVLAALDASGRTRKPSREWLVELLAGGPDAAPLTIALR